MVTGFVAPAGKEVIFRPNPIVVGIADFKVYNKPDRDIVTYSLGSCIGLTLYDRFAKVGGMIHVKLPDSQQFGKMAEDNPAAFPDTGVPALMSELFTLGAHKRRLVAKIAGGAHVLKTENSFNISERNYHSMVDTLKHWAVRITAEDVGKELPRTMYLEMSTGKTLIKTGQNLYEI